MFFSSSLIKLSRFQLDHLLLNDTHMLLSIFSSTMFVIMSLFLFCCQQCSFLLQVCFLLLLLLLLFLFFEASLFVCEQIWFGGDRSSWKLSKIPKALMSSSFLRKTGEIKLPPCNLAMRYNLVWKVPNSFSSRTLMKIKVNNMFTSKWIIHELINFFRLNVFSLWPKCF